LSNYVCPDSKRLIYVVEVDGEEIKVPFGDIETLHSHTQRLEEENGEGYH